VVTARCRKRSTSDSRLGKEARRNCDPQRKKKASTNPREEQRGERVKALLPIDGIESLPAEKITQPR